MWQRDPGLIDQQLHALTYEIYYADPNVRKP